MCLTARVKKQVLRMCLTVDNHVHLTTRIYGIWFYCYLVTWSFGYMVIYICTHVATYYLKILYNHLRMYVCFWFYKTTTCENFGKISALRLVSYEGGDEFKSEVGIDYIFKK